MKLQLADELSSPQDLKAAIMDIRLYAKWFEQAVTRKKVSGSASDDAPSILPPATDLIKQWHAHVQPSRDSFDSLITALDNYLARAPRIYIPLAAVPNTDLKKKLIAWCRQNINAGILVEFKLNSTMLGGLAVRHGSHTYDWSFRRQILAARNKFPEILRNV